MKPTLSIIIPVYNVEVYLKQCLDSVLVDNSFTGQVICVNDGSTDGSLAILEQYAATYPNIEIISQQNQGQSVARNTGLDHANGDYVLFLDSDDYYSKGTIDYLAKLAVKNPEIDFFYMDCAVLTNGKRFYSLWYKEPVKMSLVDYYDYEYTRQGTTPPGCICGGMYKRAFIEQNHLRMLPNCRYEDELFVFDVFLSEGMCMALHVEEPFYNYRVGHDGATTAKYSLTHFYNRTTITHACYEAMQKKGLKTEARRHHIFELFAENLVQAYLSGFKSKMEMFFTQEDMLIMSVCTTTKREEKLARLAKVSPRLMAAYRTENLPSILRRMINKYW